MKRRILTISLLLIIIFLSGCNSRPEITPELKEKMEKDINEKLVTPGQKATPEEVKQLGYMLFSPKYLPERFKLYGTYMQNQPTDDSEKIIKQVWCDPVNLEAMMVAISKYSEPDQTEGKYYTTQAMDNGVKVSDTYKWATDFSSYHFTQPGFDIYVTLLSNGHDKPDEYEKILKSFK